LQTPTGQALAVACELLTVAHASLTKANPGT